MASKKEFEGKTLEDAIGAAANRLGVGREDLDFDIVETGRKGLFGLGQRQACISVDLPEQAQAPAPSRGRSARRKPAGRPQTGGEGRSSDRETAPREDGEQPRRRRRRRRRGRGAGGQGAEAAGTNAARSDQAQPQVPDNSGLIDGAAPTGNRRPSGGRGRGGGGGQREEGQESGRPRRRRRGGRNRRSDSPSPRRSERNDGPSADQMQEHPQRLEIETTVQEMIAKMDFAWTASAVGIPGGVKIDLSGEKTDVLMVDNADLLLSLQFVLNRMARRAWPEIPRIVVSCDGYRSKRDEDIVELAREVADQVAQTGEAKDLHEMNPYERRLVHVLVQDYDKLQTSSVGNGFLKKVRIEPVDVEESIEGKVPVVDPAD